MLKLGAFQRHLQGEYLGGFPVQSAWGSLHTTRLQDSGPQPQGLFACTREGLKDTLSLWLVNPAKKALLPMTVPDRSCRFPGRLLPAYFSQTRLFSPPSPRSPCISRSHVSPIIDATVMLRSPESSGAARDTAGRPVALLPSLGSWFVVHVMS